MVITDTTSRLSPSTIRVTLVPRGEIDAGSLEDFSTSVHEALCSGVHELDVDLGQVSFMDTDALQVLEHAREMLEWSGGHLCLRNATPPVARLLALTAF